jgi:choline dehydrogenase-like flavoprotein
LESATLVVIGTGFASSFFLHRYLESAPKNARVIVLERGPLITHVDQLVNRQPTYLTASSFYDTDTPEKQWYFSVAMGGGSNCWWGNTPRLHPSDFELATRYGVGTDWPIAYGDLEAYYCEAEALMAVSGDSTWKVIPRSKPYLQGPHRASRPAQLLADAYPEQFVMTPCARPRETIGNGRTVCCNNGVCDLCPIDAKFSILNGFMHVYEDSRVRLIRPAEALRFEHSEGVVKRVVYRVEGEERVVEADSVALGANALFNPIILQNSGLEDAAVGRYVHEQVGVPVVAYLDGLRGFGGSSSLTGYFYSAYDGEHRRERAGALIELFNILDPGLVRLELNKGLDVLQMKVVYEDLPQAINYVRPSLIDTSRPFVEFHGHSSYVDASIKKLREDLAPITDVLPVEELLVLPAQVSEAHIQGTTRMGNDPNTSVVESFCVGE